MSTAFAVLAIAGTNLLIATISAGSAILTIRAIKIERKGGMFVATDLENALAEADDSTDHRRAEVETRVVNLLSAVRSTQIKNDELARTAKEHDLILCAATADDVEMARLATSLAGFEVE